MREMQRALALVEDEHRRLLAALAAWLRELRRERRLAGAGGADHERAGAALDAAAQQRVDAAMPLENAPLATACGAPRRRGAGRP
jgi:hypothetical protein